MSVKWISIWLPVPKSFFALSLLTGSPIQTLKNLIFLQRHHTNLGCGSFHRQGLRNDVFPECFVVLNDRGSKSNLTREVQGWLPICHHLRMSKSLLIVRESVLETLTTIEVTHSRVRTVYPPRTQTCNFEIETDVHECEWRLPPMDWRPIVLLGRFASLHSVDFFPICYRNWLIRQKSLPEPLPSFEMAFFLLSSTLPNVKVIKYMMADPGLWIRS